MDGVASAETSTFAHSPSRGRYIVSRSMRRSRSIAALEQSQALHFGLLDVHSKLLLKVGFDNTIRVRWTFGGWLLGTKRGQVLGLIGIALLLLFFGTFAWVLAGGNSQYGSEWYAAFWFSWCVFSDPGTQMGLSAGERALVKVIAVTLSVIGFLYNLVTMSFMVEMVRVRLERWRRERYRFVANDHTLLLGWNTKSLYIIEELIHSAANRGLHMSVVVMADRDINVLQQEIDRHFRSSLKGASVRLFQGSPSECADLQRVCAVSAREIIILGQQGPALQAHLATVRSIVALAALPEQPKGPIIAEANSPETHTTISAVLDNAAGIYAKDAVRRVLCLTAARPAIGSVFQSLMSWIKGSEIYCESLEALGVPTARSIGEAQRGITAGIVIGVRPKDEFAVMSPPDDRAITPTDRLLVLAESATEIEALQSTRSSRMLRMFDRRLSMTRGSTTPTWSRACSSFTAGEVKHCVFGACEPQTLILVGWPLCMDNILMLLDEYLVPNSTVIVLAEMGPQGRPRRVSPIAFPVGANKFDNYELLIKTGSTRNVDALADVLVHAPDACAVVVLTDDSQADETLADSVCLAATITIDALLKGKYPSHFKPREDGHRPRLICDVQSPVVERALPDSHKLRETAMFFPSSALETGLFTLASAETPVYNSLLFLLQNNAFGDLGVALVRVYFSAEELAEAAGQTEEIRYDVCFEKVRSRGDVLLGKLPRRESGENVPDHEIELNPRREGFVGVDDHLIVISRAVEERCEECAALRLCSALR